MTSSMVKILGFGATIVGATASVVGAFVEDKKMEQRINDGIDKALAEREQSEEES